MTSTQTLLKRIAKRAETEPENVLPVLRVLAGESPYDPEPDPITEPDPALLAVAIEINRARIKQGRQDFVAHAWPTERVAELLDVHSRQAVAQRRARGTLLGAKIGTKTYYPRWQFGPDGVAPGLDRLLAALPRDAVSADNIVRTKHSELGGRCLGDLFAAGEWDDLLAWLGDIAGWRE